jgi:hypothetical protein
MSVKKASELADIMLKPEDTTQDVKRTRNDLANELDLFSDIEAAGQPPRASHEVHSQEDLTAPAGESDRNYEISSRTAGGGFPVAGEGDNIIHYTAEDKRRLLRDLGAEVEFGIPQDGKETVIKTGPKRFEDGVIPTFSERTEREPRPKPEKKPKVKHKRRKKIRDEEEKRSFVGMVVLIAFIIAAFYGGLIFYVYTVNGLAYEAIIAEIDPKLISQKLDISVPDPNITKAEKELYKLSPFLIDSDSDGLTDHFELDRGFAPALADTDGDGMPDGAEYYAGTDPKNPMSDGVTPDSQREYTYSLDLDEVQLTATGDWLIYESIFEPYPMSFTNRPGVISGVYELVLPSAISSANIAFDLSKMNIDRWGEGSVPSIYCYNPEDGTFAKKDSSVSGNIISAALGSGVYFVAADGVIEKSAGLNIMFVIDNSGSMYSADEVDGSEENDLEFRRVDFAEDLIEAIGNDANFGVSKFTLNYKLLSEISEDDSEAEAALETIRTEKENWNGTEISQSIISAVPRFKDFPSDRNYIILITDGLPTNYNRDNELSAIEICKENNISLITIGLGKKIDNQFLSEAAQSTGGVYYQAVNNTGFESITEKIAEFLTTDRNTKAPAIPDSNETESTAAVDVIMLADSGFSASEDRLSFVDVVTTDDKNGSDLGLALINKYYYSGTLPLKASAYTANDRSEVRGYDISAIEFFKDGKSNLSEYVIPVTAAYQKYANIGNKWDFDASENGVLPLSKEAAEASAESFFTRTLNPYSYDGKSNVPEILQMLTFMRNKPFDSYETAVIDTSKLTSPEADVLSAINYYNNYNRKSGVYMYSFGVNGKTAFSTLQNDLTLGRPSVLVVDGKVYNAAKLSRMRNDGRSFIIECYDPGALSSTPIYVYLRATKLLDGTGGFQYTASLTKAGGNTDIYLITDGNE